MCSSVSASLYRTVHFCEMFKNCICFYKNKGMPKEMCALHLATTSCLWPRQVFFMCVLFLHILLHVCNQQFHLALARKSSQTCKHFTRFSNAGQRRLKIKTGSQQKGTQWSGFAGSYAGCRVLCATGRTKKV